MALDETKLNQLLGQMLSDLGGAASISMVRMGDALGLYKAMHEKGPMTCDELATAAGVNERYLREWLSHQVFDLAHFNAGLVVSIVASDCRRIGTALVDRDHFRRTVTSYRLAQKTKRGFAIPFGGQ